MPESQGDGGPPEEFQDLFARIEARVDEGDTDLSRLGFWRLVRRLKADRMLSAHWAEVVGRIDRKAFERRVRPRFPVWLGNAALLFGTLVGAGAMAYATLCDNRPVSGALLVASGGILSVTTHDLAHWAAGRRSGIRFLCYFLDGPFRVQPGLKIDYATYLRAEPGARAFMHASGAIASKAVPFVAVAVWPITPAPAWAVWTLAGMGGVQVATDLIWSTKKSDWKKVRRELAVARVQRAAQRAR